MIQTGFESRVKIQQIIDNQLPEFVLDENPKAVMTSALSGTGVAELQKVIEDKLSSYL